MHSAYHSFLICQHPDRADVYLNGIPLGQVIGGKFVPQTTLDRVTGEKKPFHVKDVPQTPFKSACEFANGLRALADAIGRYDDGDKVTVFINGKATMVNSHITYEDIIEAVNSDYLLHYNPERDGGPLSVAYTEPSESNARAKGILIPRESMVAREGTRFTAVHTGNA